jgi:SAM-dependent methyltransferase
VFDRDSLVQRASQYPFFDDETIRNIEDVDLLGSSAEIEALLTERGVSDKFDYIVSSHNFEHIPDPIKFLKGCQAVLKMGGVVSMAIPDHRGCFDFYRPVSTTASLIAANFEKAARPAFAQHFEQQSLHCYTPIQGQQHISFSSDVALEQIFPFRNMKESFEAWKAFANSPDEIYRDTHCWVFTPASFELILRDLFYLEAIDLEVFEVDAVHGEFYAHLRLADRSVKESDAVFFERRLELLRKMNDEMAQKSLAHRDARDLLAGQADREHWLQEREREVIEGLRGELENLRRERDAVLGSTFWRATYPIRALIGALRRTRAQKPSLNEEKRPRQMKAKRA